MGSLLLDYKYIVKICLSNNVLRKIFCGCTVKKIYEGCSETEVSVEPKFANNHLKTAWDGRLIGERYDPHR
jgi:hypothetical protein